MVELIISVGLAVIIGVLVIQALNPAGQIAAGRNGQRRANLNTILTGIRENLADSRTGIFSCPAGDLPTSSKKMASSGTGTYDIAGCLIPTYLPILPFDPSAPGTRYNSNSDYDTGYYLIKNASTSQITVSAPAAELNQTISVTR